MASLRKTILIGRTEADALWVQVNYLVADIAAVLARAGNRLLALVPIAAIVADLTALRATVAAVVVDVTALRATVATLVTAYNATLAKLDADATVTDTNYAATNPGSAPSAITSSAPAALTASATVGVANGTTAGKLKLAGDAEFCIAGTVYKKAATDDLWDLSAETDTTGAQYRAYWLYLNSSGTASVGAGTNAASAAAALLALPAITATKAVIGVYVAGLSTNFDDAGGLAAQGTIYNGFPGNAAVDALTATTTTLFNA
jgi:uncharacterized protein